MYEMRQELYPLPNSIISTILFKTLLRNPTLKLLKDLETPWLGKITKSNSIISVEEILSMLCNFTCCMATNQRFHSWCFYTNGYKFLTEFSFILRSFS